MLNVIRKIVAKLPEAQKTRLARIRRPKFTYLLRPPTKPISNCHGFDRGTPVDRHYIEAFLEENSSLIRGLCLEVTDAGYTRRFGREVQRVDVLDINPGNKQANIICDLRRLDRIDDETYDCFILTQVLQYIDDLDAAVAEVARILKPGGSVLVTLPALHVMEPLHPHFWKFSTHSARYLFGKHFPADHLDVRGWGNVATGVASLVGLSQEDLPKRHMECHDPEYTCTISVRATKPLRGGAAAAAADTDRSPRAVAVAVGLCTGAVGSAGVVGSAASAIV
jgi:SAM-dependent methyltransferase